MCTSKWKTPYLTDTVKLVNDCFVFIIRYTPSRGYSIDVRMWTRDGAVTANFRKLLSLVGAPSGLQSNDRRFAPTCDTPWLSGTPPKQLASTFVIVNVDAGYRRKESHLSIDSASGTSPGPYVDALRGCRRQFQKSSTVNWRRSSSVVGTRQSAENKDNRSSLGSNPGSVSGGPR